MTMFKTRLHKGNPKFSRAAYAVSVEYQDGMRAHVECFYGHDGRKVRAEALRYAKQVKTRDALPSYVQRSAYLPTTFGLSSVEI